MGSDAKEEWILGIFDAGVLKFGRFALDSGVEIPIYLDLNELVSFPRLLKSAAVIIKEEIEKRHLSFDHVVGVPMAALAATTTFAVTNDVSMLLRRKEAKAYGLKRVVEGVYKEGDTCLVIEDMTHSGRALFQTAAALEAQGLQVSDGVALLELGMGAKRNLSAKGINLWGCVEIDEAIHVASSHGKFTEAEEEIVLKYFRDNKFLEVINLSDGV